MRNYLSNKVRKVLLQITKIIKCYFLPSYSYGNFSIRFLLLQSLISNTFCWALLILKIRHFIIFSPSIAILNELWKNREEEIKAKTWKN